MMGICAIVLFSEEGSHLVRERMRNNCMVKKKARIGECIGCHENTMEVFEAPFFANSL